MQIEKRLEKLNIHPVEKLSYEDKISIARKVSEQLSENVKELNEKYNEINMRILNCEMYYAEIDSKFGSVFYYYKNNALYLKYAEEIVTEQLVHECIHCLQNYTNITKKKKRAGLSNFDSFKIIGLGISEAITKYISSIAVEKNNRRVDGEQISIVTNSDDQYRYMTGLINQIIFLMGRENAITSAINSTDKFEDDLYNTFEENTNKILKNFDLLLEENEKENPDENKKIELYMQTQEMIYKAYFSKMYKRIETKEELDSLVQKLFDYENIVGMDKRESNYNKTFNKFREEMDLKFYRKYTLINTQSLVKVEKKSIFIKMLDGLRQMISNIKEKV